MPSVNQVAPGIVRRPFYQGDTTYPCHVYPAQPHLRRVGTSATMATMTLAREHGHLTVQIISDGVEGVRFVPITLGSIAGRAIALGGRVRVEPQDHAQIAVIVEIPL